jgi:hypothetical protein
MARVFLTKTARSQGQSIIFLRNPFKLVPIKDLAEIVDKFTRNEVASSNDMRAVIGWKPSKDPNADKLLNKNLPAPVPPPRPARKPNLALMPMRPQVPTTPQGVSSQNGT